jgi:hypothetical protein
MNKIYKTRTKQQITNDRKYIFEEEIPFKYKEETILLDILEGNTSLVYGDPDKKFIYMFTRDLLKVQYLQYLNLVIDIEDQILSDFLKPLEEFPINVIKIQYLYPLNTENLKLANTTVNIIEKINDYLLNQYTILNVKFNNNSNEMTKHLKIYLDEKYPHIKNIDQVKDNITDTIIYSLYNFFSNVTEEFVYTITTKQFMQNKNEELILLDPIISYRPKLYSALDNI